MAANKSISQLIHERYCSEMTRKSALTLSPAPPKHKSQRRSRQRWQNRRNKHTAQSHPQPKGTVEQSREKSLRPPKPSCQYVSSTSYDPTTLNMLPIENPFFEISRPQKVTDEELYNEFKTAQMTQKIERAQWRKRRYQKKKKQKMNSDRLVKAYTF